MERQPEAPATKLTTPGGSHSPSVRRVFAGYRLAEGTALASTFCKETVTMHGSSDARINPIKEQAAFLKMIRRIVLDIAPYGGMLSATVVSPKDGYDADSPLRLTADRCRIPGGLKSRYRSMEDPGAAESLLALLVRLYREALDFDGDIAITLHETRSRLPVAGLFDSHSIHLEFGAIRAEDSASH